jgi:hypothetical protein
VLVSFPSFPTGQWGYGWQISPMELGVLITSGRRRT